MPVRRNNVAARCSFLEAPNYVPSEAAWALNVPRSTLHDWISPKAHRSSRGPAQRPPLVTPAGRDQRGPMLSFMNLVELHILRAFRRANVSMPNIRRAVDWLREYEKGERHPLVRNDLHTFGDGVFIEKLGEIIEISCSGQRAIHEAVAEHLQRVEWEDKTVPRRIFPLSAGPGASFEINPNVAYGQLVLRGTRIPVEPILDRFDAGESIGSLAYDYGQETKTIEATIYSFRPRVAA